MQGADSKGKLWLSHALESMTALEADKKHVEVVSDADDEIKSLRTQAFEILKTLKTKDSQTARGAVILLSFLILQTYDEVDDALDNLEDTVSACRDLFKDAKSDKKKRKSAGADEVAADVPPPIDALLDVLIALLDKSSADLRALANLIFGMISTDFTASSIQHLVAVSTRSLSDGTKLTFSNLSSLLLLQRQRTMPRRKMRMTRTMRRTTLPLMPSLTPLTSLSNPTTMDPPLLTLSSASVSPRLCRCRAWRSTRMRMRTVTMNRYGTMNR